MVPDLDGDAAIACGRLRDPTRLGRVGTADLAASTI
jgi:hypothetical protein